MWELFQSCVICVDGSHEEAHGLYGISATPFLTRLFELDALLKPTNVRLVVCIRARVIETYQRGTHLPSRVSRRLCQNHFYARRSAGAFDDGNIINPGTPGEAYQLLWFLFRFRIFE